MKKYLFILLATVALFSSCKREDPAKITLSKDTVTLSSSEAQATLSFTTNYDWKATSDASWLTLEKTSGVAGSVSLSAKVALAELDERTANVVITCRDAKETIKVIQKQKDQILLSSKAKTSPAEGETFTVTFGTNVSYQIQIPSEATWIRELSLKSYETKEATFVVDANDSYDERTVEIRFKSNSSDVYDVFVVTQAAKNGLIVDPSKVEIDHQAQEIQMEVLYNVDYSVGISGGWLKLVRDTETKALKSDKYKFAVTENTSKKERTATVTFTSSKTGLKQVYTVTQLGVPCRVLSFEIKANEYTVPEISGAAVEGTIDWGDGATEAYSSGKTHMYDKFDTYTVVISTYFSDSFGFSNVSGVQEIDFSQF